MHLLIDTDPAMGTIAADPEDSFAITYAANSPEASLHAVTVVQGNVPLRHGYANTAHLLKLLDRTDITLAAGAATPLAGATVRATQMRELADRDKLGRMFPAVDGPYPGPSAVETIRQIAEDVDDLVVVAIGPLTNIAAAVHIYPHLVDRISKLVVMGGVFFENGNTTPAAEFNFWMDPEAAQVVLDSGLNPVLVGLDVCHRTFLTRAQIDTARTGTALGDFFHNACGEWLTAMDDENKPGMHLFDSLAVAAALNPDLLITEPAWVQVETRGDVTPGASIAWLAGRHTEWTRPTPRSNAHVATDLDLDAFTALFTQRVLANL